MTINVALGTDEDKIASLFQPDTILLAEYLETVQSKSYRDPERRLMLAVLEDAIACFQKNVLAEKGKGKRLFLEAEEWILEGSSDRLFSYEFICETLGLSPGYIRKGLMSWKQERLKERSNKARLYRLEPRANGETAAAPPPDAIEDQGVARRCG